MDDLTGEQIRAARALLRMEQADLAERAGVSLPTIKRLELTEGQVGGYDRTVDAIKKALQKAGVQFIAQNGEGPGVRLTKRQPVKAAPKKKAKARK